MHGRRTRPMKFAITSECSAFWRARTDRRGRFRMKSVLLACCLLLAIIVSVHVRAEDSDPYTLQAAEFYSVQAEKKGVAPALDPQQKATLEYKISQDENYLKITVLLGAIAVALVFFTLLIH